MRLTLSPTNRGTHQRGEFSHILGGQIRQAGVPPVGIMGRMPMPRQGRTGFCSFFSLRLCDFALICRSLLASSASAGYPPETEALHVEANEP